MTKIETKKRTGLRWLILISLMILTGILVFGSYILRTYFEINFVTDTVLNYGFKIFLALVIIIVVKLLIVVITNSMEKRLEKKQVSDERIFISAAVLRIFSWTIAIFVIIALFVESWGSLITALGIVGAGLAVSLQHPILNFLGWFVIIFNKPFVVGDRIELDGMVGDIFDITVMHTKMRKLDKYETPTGKYVVIPNEKVLTHSIINHSKTSPYIWDDIIFTFTYKSNMIKAKKILTEAFESKLKNYKEMINKIKIYRKYTEEKLPNKPQITVALGESSVNMRLKYLVGMKEKVNKKSEIIKEVYKKVRKEREVSFAFPHLQIIQEK